MRAATKLVLVASAVCLWAGASRWPARLEMVPPPPPENAGAQLDPAFELGSELRLEPSFYEMHAALVRSSLFYFSPNLVGLHPLLRPRLLEITPPSASFVPVARTDDLLALARERDRVLLFHERAPVGESLGAGLSLFIGATIGAAHAPHTLRLIFNGPVHLGPAVLDGSGVGMAVGGRM